MTQIENLFIDLRDHKYNPENNMDEYYDSYQILAYSKRVIDKYGYVKILDKSHYNIRSTKVQVESLINSGSQFSESEYKLSVKILPSLKKTKLSLSEKTSLPIV